MNSHYGITCELACHMRQSNSKHVTFRKLKSINSTKFRADIHNSPSLSDTAGSADDMIERYAEILTSLLDIHTPIIHCIVIPRPNASWYKSSLHTAKSKQRTLERSWRCSRKQTDRVAYGNQCAVVAKQLSDTKQKYYSDKIIECAGNAKMLHSITNKLSIDQQTQQLLHDDDDTHLANRFCDYFTQKIDIIQNNFTLTTETEESLSQDIKFDHFRSVSADEIRKIITAYNS